MALKFKMYKSNRKGKTQGKWYARAVHEETIDTDGLAEIMQANSTVKASDILAVLRELVETMTNELQSSKRVKLNGFGTFKLGINSTPAESSETFKVQTNISGAHVLFQPEVTIDAQGIRQRKLVSGVKLQEATPYNVEHNSTDDTNTSDKA